MLYRTAGPAAAKDGANEDRKGNIADGTVVSLPVTSSKEEEKSHLIRTASVNQHKPMMEQLASASLFKYVPADSTFIPLLSLATCKELGVSILHPSTSMSISMYQNSQNTYRPHAMRNPSHVTENEAENGSIILYNSATMHDARCP